MKLDPNLDFAATLRAAQNDSVVVTLRLTNGSNIAGRVGGVADHAVLIEEIAGKEYFDAAVRLDHITAIEVRARS